MTRDQFRTCCTPCDVRIARWYTRNAAQTAIKTKYRSRKMSYILMSRRIDVSKQNKLI